MRKLNHHVLSIMQPKDIALQDEYYKAKEIYNEHKKVFDEHEEVFREVQTRWHGRLELLNAIFEPGLDKVEQHISEFTPEYIYETQKDRVYGATRIATGVKISKQMFGRLMKENGYTITTRTITGPRGGKRVIRIWKFNSE